MAPTFEEVDSLCNSITEFLLGLGGAYTEEYVGTLQEHIIWSLVMNKYLWEPDKYFVSWWMIYPEDIDSLEDKILPVCRLSGTTCYIVEMGIAPRVSIREVISKIRYQEPTGKGVCWYNFSNKQFKYFSNQVGKKE